MTGSHKMVSGIDRECKALTAGLVEGGEQLQVPEDTKLVLRHSPERIVLQVGRIGWSISCFKNRAPEELGVSLMVAEWEGTITFPGEAALEGRRAKQINERLFHLAPSAEGAWHWVDQSNGMPFTSHALSDHLIAGVAERLAVPPVFHE